MRLLTTPYTFLIFLFMIIGVSSLWYETNTKAPITTADQAQISEPNNQPPLSAETEPPLAIGQLFMIGHWAETPVASTTKLIEQYGIGGVVIMSAPSDPQEILAWTKEWQQVSKTTLLIAIDQEGGPVSRLRGESFIQTGQSTITDTPTAFTVGQTRGTELQSLGITMNFAPVLDSAAQPNSFMYERAFPNRNKSARLAAAMIDGMAEAGVTGVVKHFPGHADTVTDSHNELPTVTITKAELDNFLAPFSALLTSHPPVALMTAHVSFPSIDPYPATLSPFWITDYLRGTLGYKGVVITDDMIMDAIDTTWTHDEASVMALQAGADIILYAAEPAKVTKAIETVTAAISDGTLASSRINESLERINSLKTDR